MKSKQIKLFSSLLLAFSVCLLACNAYATVDFFSSFNLQPPGDGLLGQEVRMATLASEKFVVVRQEGNAIVADILSVEGGARRESLRIQVSRFVSTSLENLQPYVASFPKGGSFVVTYVCEGLIDNGDSTRRDICVSRFDITGQRIGEESVVTDNGDFGFERPIVGTFSDDGFVVAWGRNSDDLYLQMYDFEGTRIGLNSQVLENQVVDTNSAGLPFRIAVLDDDSFAISFSREAGDDLILEEEVRVQRFSRQGKRRGRQIRVTDSLIGEDLSQVETNIAATVGGGFVVAFVSDTGFLELVGARVYDSSGRPLGPQIWVNNDIAENDAGGISVVGTPQGGFIVTWIEDSIGTPGDDYVDGSSIFSREFDAQGQALGPTNLVLDALQEDDDNYSIVNRFPGIDRYLIVAYIVESDNTALAIASAERTRSPTAAPTQAAPPSPFSTSGSGPNSVDFCSSLRRRSCIRNEFCRFSENQCVVASFIND